MIKPVRWLMIGTIIFAVLLTIFIPKYKSVVLKSKETILKDNLLAMRRTIEQYTKDKEQPPHSLQDLVVAGYLRELPVDPITNSNSMWKPVIDTVVVSPERTDHPQFRVILVAQLRVEKMYEAHSANAHLRKAIDTSRITGAKIRGGYDQAQ